LILYGAYARGKLSRNPSAHDFEEAETLLKLRHRPAFQAPLLYLTNPR
jgi:hypothetical protein